MADFNPKKLQVFVSSTYEDLVKQRQAAVEAILSAGHIPAGMELFTAGDESQMETIKRWIDESDVYLLILGGRYGSIEPKTNKSYIHLEYEYAVAQKKPFFTCVITDKALDTRLKSEGTGVIEREHPQELRMFRHEVLTKMAKFWEDTKDIKITVIESLSQFARRDNLVGWVRPNTQSNLPALADEIARLSKENDELRRRVKEFEDARQGTTIARPKTMPVDFYKQFAKSHPRNAINQAWEYMESVVHYALVTNGLGFDPGTGLRPKMAQLIGHGDVSLAEGERVLGDFYQQWAVALNDPEFKSPPEEVLRTINGLLNFSSELLEKCDAIEDAEAQAAEGA